MPLPDDSTKTARPRPRRHVKRALGVGFEVALALIAAVIVAAAIGAGTGWWHFEVIESGSMTPALRVGGVAVVQAEPVSAVRVGQIIAVHPPEQPGIVRIHRVIEVVHRGSQVWVRTKGDANKLPDPGPIRLVGSTAYAERFFVPYAGYLGVWLYKHSTRLILEVVMFALIVGGGLVLIWGKDDAQRPAEASGAKNDEQEGLGVVTVVASETVASAEAPSAEPPALPAAVATGALYNLPANAATQAAAATLASLGHVYSAADETQRTGEMPEAADDAAVGTAK
ncbi:MAG: signal peptidase I [Acidimicrobiales bacterium]